MSITIGLEAVSLPKQTASLLLCFFIIFFSFDKTPKVKKELSVLDKISSYFDPNAGKGTGPGNAA